MCVTTMPWDAMEKESVAAGPFGSMGAIVWTTGCALVLEARVVRSRATDTTSPVFTSFAAAMRLAGVM